MTKNSANLPHMTALYAKGIAALRTAQMPQTSRHPGTWQTGALSTRYRAAIHRLPISKCPPSVTTHYCEMHSD
jgi:hypothetical protein